MADFANLVLGVDTRGLKKGERALDDTTRAGRKTERATDGAAAGMGRLGATSGGVAAAGMRKFAVAATAAVGALVAVVAAGAGLNKFVSATVEADAAQAQLAAALLSTGGAAGKTIGQLNAHASALQGVTKFGDEATNAMQGVLLTFTQIQGGTFDRATVATMDLATAMGTDLKAAALQVGKALNDPVLGMTALSRSGIQFTEAQKDVVKAMVATNDITGAQGIILGELEKQFGGSAAAARDTLGGALAALGNSFGDLFELSGPATEKLRASIDGLIETITTPSFVAGLQNIGALLFGIAGAALKVVGAFGQLIGAAGNLLTLGSATRKVADASDIANLAIADELAQLNALGVSMQGGITLSRDVATVKLIQARASISAADAMRLENVELTKQSRGYTSLTDKIDIIRLRLEGAQEDAMLLDGSALEGMSLAAEAAANRVGEISGELRDAVAEQQELLNLASKGSEEYDAAQAAVAVLSAALLDAQGDVIVLNANTAAAADTTGSLARLAGDAGANLNAASVEAAQLARNLLQAASALSSVMSATANINVSAIGMEAQNKAIEAGNTLIQSRTAGLLASKRVELADAFGSSDGAIRAAAAAELESYTEAVMRNSDAQAVNEALTKAATAAIGGGGGGGLIKAAEDLTPALDDAGDAAENLGKAKAQILVSGIDSMAGAFGDFVSGGLKDFKGFALSIVDTFKRMLSQMIAMAVKNKIMISLGMGGAGAGAAAGAAGGGVMSGLVGGFGTAATAGSAAVAGTGFLGGLGSVGSGLMSGGLSGGAGALTTALSGSGGLMAAAGAAVLPLAAVFAVVSFFKSKTKTIDEGIKGVISMENAAFQSFQKIEKSRFFGLSKKRSTITKTLSAGPMDQAAFLVRESVVGAAESLGVSSSIFDGFTHRFSLSLKGLDEAAKSAAISKEFARMGESLANLVPHIDSVNQLFAVAQNRVALTERLLQAQGKSGELTAILRGREMDATNEHNKALLAQIFAAEDAAAAVNTLSDAMNLNENAFATGVDFRRGLSRAANNIAYSPEKSQAEMLAELKSLNARIDVLQSTSEITANSSSQTAENTDYTNALTLEAAT